MSPEGIKKQTRPPSLIPALFQKRYKANEHGEVK